ncbi:hypothetical protein SAMN05216343_10767 [Oscillibacter sp. PC13]|uniref:nitrogen fixation protein n=1 Tax=Oscillibacter sp. PC13 TaxID=1855299 RepID=UPI0008E70814|nr:nitrogen fixation protein [Oscillibacter sp. PC13]SFP42306.1 hypothetical protein SAMN05216343_10767 [Oscillibacter sp. PC13]
MNKNMNHPTNDIINEFTEKFGDKEVRMTFRTVKEGMDSYFGLIEMTAELVRLIREEEMLRKHHRAYLHVREAILEGCNELMAYINAELTKCGEERHFHYIPKSECSNDYPFAEAEDADDDEDEETVTIFKGQYEDMIDDLLTMAELIDMVSDMRTKDIRFIQEMAKFMPAYAEYEKSRLSLYREAAKEAEAIFDRWEDEIEDDYEPEEYFSD